MPDKMKYVQDNCCSFFLLLDFGLSRLTSLQFIQYHVAGFYKPFLKVHPPICGITAHATMPG